MEAGKRALDFSMKAIDAYKKTFLVDKVTSDDERPPPVHTLDEIADILRSCSLDLTQEIVEYTFRRLRRRSPYVKRKVLGFIKYTVEKAGSSSYRRELQSRSLAIRGLVKYQGEVDPLKGNAPNQAVRDAAQEAIKAIFSSDVSYKDKNIRIEGFGNGSFSKLLTSSYRSSGYGDSKGSQSFDYCDSDESLENCKGNGSFEYQNNNDRCEFTRGFDLCDGAASIVSPNCEQDKKGIDKLSRQSQGSNFCTQSEKVASPEERLVNNVTTLIGSRLRPTEQSLLSFLSSAKTLDAARISHALKTKLQSSSWQVRLRALCVLKAILLQKGANLLQEIEADEEDFHGFVQECLQSVQATIRREAKEALDLLLSLKEEKLCGNAVTGLVVDALAEKPLIAMEAENEVYIGTGSVSASSAVQSQYKAVDLLSFEMEELTCGQAADNSSNPVIDDPFDGMCIYGVNDKASIHVKDLLSDGWVSAHTEMPFESSVSWQASAIKQRQCEMDALGFNSILDLSSAMSYSTGKHQASLDSKLSQSISNGKMAGLHNLEALYMHPKGAIGSLYSSSCL